jgi:SprT-like family
MDVQRLFERFNQKYFGNRMPAYRVAQSDSCGSIGVCRKKQRAIHLSAGLRDSLVRTTLLHEMAHAATSPRHGPVWQKEMRRLIRLLRPPKATYRNFS